MIALLQEAYEMLQMHQFVPDRRGCENDGYYDDYTPYSICPSCGESREDGHSPQCELNNLIQKIGTELGKDTK